jgi:hypothetical protein
MSTEPKTEIASDTIKTVNAKLTLENGHLQKVNTQLAEENKLLKTQLEQANGIIENDLKSDLILKIQAASEYQEADLLKLSPVQLQTIEETLSKSKTYTTETANYKSIRAGNASADSNLTVGNLYHKTKEEIQKMGGDF